MGDSTTGESEKRPVFRFVLTTWAPGRILSREDCEAIEAAQLRLFKQIRAAAANGKKGAPKAVKTDKRSVQLREAQQRSRAKKKTAHK